MSEGKFIVLEGIDGAGTTTQTIRLGKYLFEKGKAYVPLLTREPTMLSEYGREIRRRLTGNLLPTEEVIHDPAYWANLFVHDRMYHINQVVEPNLRRGVQVISDRHMLSTLAYQSAQGAKLEELAAMHQGLRVPDVTLFLRVPHDKAQQRMSQDRNGTVEYFEEESMLSRVTRQYEQAIQVVGAQQNVRIIDGTLSIEEVAQKVQQEVDRLFA